jgi:hypothetical protein
VSILGTILFKLVNSTVQQSNLRSKTAGKIKSLNKIRLLWKSVRIVAEINVWHKVYHESNRSSQIYENMLKS